MKKYFVSNIQLILVFGLSLAMFGCGEDDVVEKPKASILIFPEMEGFSGDQLKIVGVNFSEDPWLWISGTEIEPDSKTVEEIVFTIPENFSSGYYDFYDGNSATRYGYFKLLEDVDTLSASVSEIDELKIIDNNRITYIENNRVVMLNSQTGDLDEIFNGTSVRDLQVLNDHLWLINNNREVLTSSDMGTSWTTITFSANQRVKDLFISESQIAVIVEYISGGAELMIKQTLGEPWQIVTTSAEFELLSTFEILYLNDKEMVMYDPENRQICLTDDTKLWASRDLEPFRSDNFGPASFYIGDLRRMWFVSGDRTVNRTRNGGKTWSASSLRLNSGKLSHLYFYNATEGIALADNGSIVRTEDGGQTWRISNIKGSFLKADFNSLTREAIVTERDEKNGSLNLAKIKFQTD